MSEIAILTLPRRTRSGEGEWLVLVVLAVALLLGWALRSAVTSATTTATVGSATISYPATWVDTKQPDQLFSAANVTKGASAEQIRLQEIPASQIAPPAGSAAAKSWSIVQAATKWSVQRGAGLVGYRILDIAQSTVQGRPAVDVTYAYLADSSGLGGASALPLIREATDTIVASGGNYDILTFAAPSEAFGELASERQSIVNNWRPAP